MDRPRVKASGALPVFVIFTRRCAGIAASPRRPLRNNSRGPCVTRADAVTRAASRRAPRPFPFSLSDRSRGSIARVALFAFPNRPARRSSDGFEPAPSRRLFEGEGIFEEKREGWKFVIVRVGIWTSRYRFKFILGTVGRFGEVDVIVIIKFILN